MKKKKSTQRGRPKDEEKAEGILCAAGDLFIERGISHTTMQDIANKAGVSKLTVYNHFGTKEELFRLIINHKCSTYMGDDVLSVALSESPEDGLFTIGIGFVGIIFNNEALSMHRTIMGESRHDKKIAKLFFENGPEPVSKKVALYLKHLQKMGACHFDDIERASEVFLSLFTGKTFLKIALKVGRNLKKKELEKFTRENVDYFFRIFGNK